MSIPKPGPGAGDAGQLVESTVVEQDDVLVSAVEVTPKDDDDEVFDAFGKLLEKLYPS